MTYHARLVLDRRLPLVLGDRLVLRDPGTRSVLGGAQVLDADPPALRRRGDGVHWAERLAGMDTAGDVLGEVAGRGAVQEDHLRRLGLLSAHEAPPPGVRVLGDWWVHAPLAPGLSRGAARDLLNLPDERLLDPVIRETGLEHEGSHVCQVPKATLAPSGLRSGG